MYLKVAKKHVVAALDQLRQISRPHGDNEGDAINDPSVYNDLSREDQKRVDHAEAVAGKYLRKIGDEGEEANARSISELRKAGYPTNLQPAQYQQDRLVGDIKVGSWTLNISDEGGTDDGD